MKIREYTEKRKEELREKVEYYFDNLYESMKKHRLNGFATYYAAKEYIEATENLNSFCSFCCELPDEEERERD